MQDLLNQAIGKVERRQKRVEQKNQRLYRELQLEEINDDSKAAFESYSQQYDLLVDTSIAIEEIVQTLKAAEAQKQTINYVAIESLVITLVKSAATDVSIKNVSLESISLTDEKRYELCLESLSDILKKIYDAIVLFLKNAIDWVKDVSNQIKRIAIVLNTKNSKIDHDLKRYNGSTTLGAIDSSGMSLVKEASKRAAKSPTPVKTIKDFANSSYDSWGGWLRDNIGVTNFRLGDGTPFKDLVESTPIQLTAGADEKTIANDLLDVYKKLSIAVTSTSMCYEDEKLAAILPGKYIINSKGKIEISFEEFKNAVKRSYDIIDSEILPNVTGFINSSVDLARTMQKGYVNEQYVLKALDKANLIGDSFKSDEIFFSAEFNMPALTSEQATDLASDIASGVRLTKYQPHLRMSAVSTKAQLVTTGRNDPLRITFAKAPSVSDILTLSEIVKSKGHPLFAKLKNAAELQRYMLAMFDPKSFKLDGVNPDSGDENAKKLYAIEFFSHLAIQRANNSIDLLTAIVSKTMDSLVKIMGIYSNQVSPLYVMREI